jgi:hypothetical protein
MNVKYQVQQIKGIQMRENKICLHIISQYFVCISSFISIIIEIEVR